MAVYLSARFWDTEECKDECNQSESREEDICAPGDGIEHIRSDQSNNAEKCISKMILPLLVPNLQVTHPCSRRCNGDSLRSNRQIEDFRGKNPANWT